MNPEIIFEENFLYKFEIDRERERDLRIETEMELLWLSMMKKNGKNGILDLIWFAPQLEY